MTGFDCVFCCTDMPHFNDHLEYSILYLMIIFCSYRILGRVMFFVFVVCKIVLLLGDVVALRD